MNQRAKGLSFYLLVASLLQIGIYSVWSFSPQKLGALFYFDPRIGLFFIESGFRGAELKIPGLLQWLSASWLFGISLLLLRGRPILKTYIISEIVASLSNLLFFVMVVLANLSPVHGFSIEELFVPVLVMILFTAVPVTVAFQMWRNNLRKTDVIPSRADQALRADSR